MLIINIPSTEFIILAMVMKKHDNTLCEVTHNAEAMVIQCRGYSVSGYVTTGERVNQHTTWVDDLIKIM